MLRVFPRLAESTWHWCTDDSVSFCILVMAHLVDIMNDLALRWLIVATFLRVRPALERFELYTLRFFHLFGAHYLYQGNTLSLLAFDDSYLHTGQLG